MFFVKISYANCKKISRVFLDFLDEKCDHLKHKFFLLYRLAHIIIFG